MHIEPGQRPADPQCPQCAATLTYVTTEISSGAFRTQSASMPQMPIHYYDCVECGTCWKLATKLLPDPVRQILKG
jgi:ferredoxin-like protein FixX